MFRIIVAGSRDFTNYKLMQQKLDHLLQNKSNICIVSGAAKGADKLGERYARDRQLQLKQFFANWNLYGKSAGYKRNEKMAQNADALVAFWDGKSRGTMHMIDLAKKYNLAVRVVRF